MQKYFNSTNIFSLLRRIKSLLEEKIKYFKENNENKIKKHVKIHKNTKVFRNALNPSINNKNNYLYQENSPILDNETMEYFDLQKMGKLLDGKNKIESDNINDFVNEAKNKRLFLMEVLKIKYQKINNNIADNLITPIMIWKEAMKKNIKKNNWSKFIFDELNNPNKYLIMIQKEKEKNKSIKEI